MFSEGCRIIHVAYIFNSIQQKDEIISFNVNSGFNE